MNSLFAKRTAYLFAALAVIVACGSASSRADLVQVRAAPSSSPPTYFIPATEGLLFGTYDGGDFGPLHTGAFNLEENRGSGWTPLVTYCGQADVGIGFGTNPPDTVGLLYDEIAITDDPHYTPQEQAEIEALWANAFVDSTTNYTDAATFQALLWEIGQDDTFNLLAGDFRLDTSDAFTATVVSRVNTWFGLIEDHTWSSRRSLELLSHPNSQALFHDLPEPGSLLLLALGGLGIAGRRFA